FFVTGFTLATLHQLKAERYAAPFFPSLWVLAGLGLADLRRSIETRDWRFNEKSEVRSQRLGDSEKVGRERQDSGDRGRSMPKALAGSAISNHQSPISNITFLFSILLIIVVAWSWLTWFPKMSPVWAGNSADALRAAGQQIRDWQQADRPVLIIGTFGELSPPFFEWRLRTQSDFANGNIQYDAPPGDGSDIERVQHWLDTNPGTQVTLIRVDEQAPLYNTADMKNKNAGRQALVRQFEQIQGYRLIKTMDYPGGGIMISYYLPQ
ncbi:MAG TPA: hypothetical protein VGK87_11745, partial [Anaerolineae bacterium]